MEDHVLQYYNPMAGDYHLIFNDWKQTVLQHGETLDRLLRAYAGPPPLSVLDCSCGIGTQAIGLAARGYKVHATDLSREAIARARREARTFGVQISFAVADLRSLEAEVPGQFGVVLSCDNALPHLSDSDLLLAARNMASKLQEGGLLVASMRDYDRAVAVRSALLEPSFYDDPEGRRIVFQVWDWAANGRNYVVHQLILKESDGDWKTSHFTGQYRARLRSEVSAALHQAGFRNIAWHMPERSGYYQPLVTAYKQSQHP